MSQCEFGKATGDHVYENEDLPGLKIAVERAEGEKCGRCWKYDTTVGANSDHPEICSRCLGVVEAM